jgi:hypothetical protein
MVVQRSPFRSTKTWYRNLSSCIHKWCQVEYFWSFRSILLVVSSCVYLRIIVGRLFSIYPGSTYSQKGVSFISLHLAHPAILPSVGPSIPLTSPVRTHPMLLLLGEGRRFPWCITSSQLADPDSSSSSIAAQKRKFWIQFETVGLPGSLCLGLVNFKIFTNLHPWSQSINNQHGKTL